jgi:hypothetical protein
MLRFKARIFGMYGLVFAYVLAGLWVLSCLLSVALV